MIDSLFDLSGKVALITGGGHGIGMAIAKVLAKAGAKVCVNGTSEEKLKKSKAEFAEDGIEVFTYAFDVSSEESVDAGIAQIEKEVGSVDILVNNAGIIKRVPILEMPVDDFKQVIDIDLVGPLVVSKRVAPGMIQKRAGKIINICSLMSIYGRTSVSAYASAKGGLKLLTANMACEWAKYNVQVNGIGPGYIETAQTAPIREGSHPFNDLVMARTPAGRWGLPEDIGYAALFLSSKASDFVNGHLLFVDGGITANFGYVAGENELE
ncbi:gluconate 5-dehydrogenase [Mangrovibacterium diazotrophicum]|uniref:Gluconate 5-dehydrogenase n=1 Tax=Mangrovibacterium diazotrophicum TaxID=1261403 RepID=A0A419VYH1_9BACT|nr:gluconate 5-dehydrogenase [Mangrovibacterium diazotrophicum]RKD88285.1 gluconate 5-dehydrogenase [Mangrovibacterium diazotrophicum]